MQWEKSRPVGEKTRQPEPATARLYRAGSARSIDLSAAARNAADFLLLIEPIWVTIAVAVVYAMVQTGGRYSLVPLVLAALPYPLRQWRKGYLSRRTPFDIPIVLFMAGAIVGTVVSKDLMLSLGALQTIVAAALLYYTLVNYRHPKHLLIGILVIACIATPLLCIWGFAAGFTPVSGESSATDIGSKLTSFLGFLPQMPLPSTYTASSNPLVHGLVIALAVTASVVLCTALFAGRKTRFLLGGPICIVVLFLIPAATGGAISHLGSAGSLEARGAIWPVYISEIQDHPLTGIGLGNSTLVDPGSVHPHNGYIELYLNYGIMGAIAALCSITIVVYLVLRILRSPHRRPWFGLGCGIALASVISALATMLESAPVGMAVSGVDNIGLYYYHYAVSPLPWILGAVIVAALQILDSADNRFMSADQIVEKLE